MYLPHTWRGEANLEEYYKTLKEIDKNLQEVKQKCPCLFNLIMRSVFRVLQDEWKRMRNGCQDQEQCRTT